MKLIMKQLIIISKYLNIIYLNVWKLNYKVVYSESLNSKSTFNYSNISFWLPMKLNEKNNNNHMSLFNIYIYIAYSQVVYVILKVLFGLSEIKLLHFGLS